MILTSDLSTSSEQVIFQTILVILFILKSSEAFNCFTIPNNEYPLWTYLSDVIYTEGWGQLVSVTE